MGKRGPQPKVKPLERIELESDPIPPPWMDKQAVKKWNEIIPQLREQGTLGMVDCGALVRYCTMWGQWMDCQATLAIEGLTYKLELTGQGEIIKERPEVKIAKQLQDAMKRIETAMGMNTQSRKQLELKPKEVKPENPFEALRIAMKNRTG